HNRDEYNFIRIEDAKSYPLDSNTDNKYTRAAHALQQFVEQKILVSEKKPAIYLHDHFFKIAGKEMMRRGIVARVRLEEWEKGIIKPHEGILAAAKDDRLNLLWALQVNTSPILAMYQDDGNKLAKLLDEQKSGEAAINALMPDGERHQVRLITDREIIKQISAHFTKVPLYIADGHHRYTSALTYKREKFACTPDASPDDALNFVMMNLVSFNDPGMVILAPHRLLRGLEHEAVATLKSRLVDFFDIEDLPLQKKTVWDEVDKLMNKPGTVRFACQISGNDYVSVLSLKPNAINTQTMPLFHSEIYRKLDVSIIDHVILEKIIGLGIGGKTEPRINFEHDRAAAINGITHGEYQVAFYVKPVKPELIKEFADAGEKMPRKSTYFYPKAPAGLVVNTLY
ncbi:MAG TPA: DUF1015 domain-containing protein, partial [Dehalococcoidales bacterium]|nr:DUF1015 domain-containing protein [Dehalococcoidales bacterium]